MFVLSFSRLFCLLNSKRTMESPAGQAKKSKMCVSALLPGLMEVAVVGLVTMLTTIKDFVGKDGPGQVFSFVLSDDTGDIRVSVFGTDLRPLLDVCQADEAVRITGGWVKKANSAYNRTVNQYEMTVSVDKSGVIVKTNETVSRRASMYRKINEISGSQINTNVDVRGTISAVEKPREVKTGAGKLVNLAKVTLVDQSGCQVSCTFWATSATKVTNWSVGDVLAIRGAQVQEFAEAVSLGCSKAEVQHWPEDSAEVSDASDWYRQAVTSQQCFEAVRITRSVQQENKASRDDEMVMQYPERMYSQFNGVQRIRLRFGDKEITFSRDGQYRSQQVLTSTPRADVAEHYGDSRMSMDE